MDSLATLGPAYPPSFPLKYKRPYARLRSNSLGSRINSLKHSSNLTGPPSPSELDAAGSISSPGTNLASSLWPHQGEPSHLFPPLTISSSTSPEPEPDSEAGTEEARPVYLPPISPSRKSGPSESLPPLIPRLPRPSAPPTHPASAPSTPSVSSKGTSPKIRPFLLRTPTVNRKEHGPGFLKASSDRSRKKNKETFWTAIQDAGVPIYLGTPGFDGEPRFPSTHANVSTTARTVFALCPSALGTYCSPSALLTAFSDIEVFYHVYAAGQKLSREDL